MKETKESTSKSGKTGKHKKTEKIETGKNNRIRLGRIKILSKLPPEGKFNSATDSLKRKPGFRTSVIGP